jgi:outer membrane protein TolC
VVVGIPADLLRRRPEVRRAERQAAAQSAQIGIAEADFYPAISINGTLGYSAQYFPDLFRPDALNGTVGPSFQWNILNARSAHLGCDIL